VFAWGNGPTRKALLRTLIAEIKVEDRTTIRPFFYVPALTSTNKPQAGVRAPGRQELMTTQHANRQLQVQGPTITL
jgi:hypothetical protein